MNDELKPPPMTMQQITIASDAIDNEPTFSAGFERGVRFAEAARDQQWLALVGELQRDAARYRYIRKNAVWRVGGDVSITWDLFMQEPDIRPGKLTGDSVAQELDSAIDAARGSKGGV